MDFFIIMRDAGKTIPLQLSLLSTIHQHHNKKSDDNNNNQSEGFALTGYDIPGCVEDGAWMLWEFFSAAAVAHPDLENGQFSSFITKSALPECANRSVSSKRVPLEPELRKVVAK